MSRGRNRRGQSVPAGKQTRKKVEIEEINESLQNIPEDTEEIETDDIDTSEKEDIKQKDDLKIDPEPVAPEESAAEEIETEKIEESMGEEKNQNPSNVNNVSISMPKNKAWIPLLVMIAFVVACIIGGGWYFKRTMSNLNNGNYVRTTDSSYIKQDVIIIGNDGKYTKDTTVIIPNTQESLDIKITTQKIFTYMIFDDFTNDAIILRSTFDDTARIVNYIKSLYPVGTNLKVIQKSETEYTKESKINTGKENSQ